MGVTFVVNLPDDFDIAKIDFTEKVKKRTYTEGEAKDTESGIHKAYEILVKSGEVWEDQVNATSFRILGDTLREMGLTTAVLDVAYEGKIVLKENAQ